MRCVLPKFSRLCLSFLFSFAALLLSLGQLHAQTSVSDPAIPVVITPSLQSSQFFVLNRDRSILGASTFSATSYALNCTANSAIAAQATATTPFTFNDRSRYLLEAGLTSGSETAIAIGADYSGSSCPATSSVAFAGTNATLSSVDTAHQREYVLSDTSGNSPDILTHFSTSGNYYSVGSLTKLAQASLDTGGRYTSMVVDSTGNTGYVAVTQLRTGTTSGGLWIYDPTFGRTVKVLAPGGTPLPAVGAFILHNPQSVGGNLLVLVNQDNLTSTNLTAPPPVTTPFTIIDLGQLGSLLNQRPTDSSVTLPFVTQISSSLNYYAIFGAAINPLDGKLYLVTGGGTSTTSIVKQVVRYDPATPASPAETVIADLSAVPLTFGSYPQIVLNASAGTMQLLTTGPNTVYSVGVAGGDTAAPLLGSTFGDGNFQPTFVATNPLMGETYIASGSGLVDILTLPAGKTRHGVIVLDGPSSTPTPNQSTSVRLQAILPVVATDDLNTTITITATAASTGTSSTFATSPMSSSLDLPRTISGTFATADTYTLVATFPGDANYPAISSPPVVVSVGKPQYTTQIGATATASTATAATATVTLSGSTYAPTGTFTIKDAASSTTLATYNLPSGAISNPVSVPFTFASGTTAVTATYSGDTQNGGSTSASVTIGGVVAKATTSLTLTAPASANSNTAFNTVVALSSASGTVPTGQVTLFATPAGSSAGQVGSVTTSAAFGAGASISVSLPSGGYTLQASYAGDANFQASSSNAVMVTVGSTSAAAVSLAPTSLTFNTVLNTTSDYQNVVLKNTGGAALTISGIAVTGTGFAQVNGCPASLSGGAQCTIRLTYTPQSAAMMTGSLVVRSSATSSPNSVALTGTGYMPLSVSASATTFADQTIGTSSFVRPTVTFTNNTRANVTIAQISSDNVTDFEPGPGCANAVVATGSSCTVLAIFHPGSAGAKSGSIRFVLSGGTTLSASFSGKGLAAGACADADGDALCDDWEKNGVWTRVTGAADQFLDLPAMGADPNHKDIFLHVDYMQTAKLVSGEHSHQLKQNAMKTLITVFNNSPLSNPDGSTGIHLHIDCGPVCTMNPVTSASWGTASKAAALTEQAVLDAVPGEPANSFDWTVFDTNSTAYLATGRSMVFHHVIMAHDQKSGNTSSGISRGGATIAEFLKGASDLVVSLGSWNNQTGTDLQQGGTLMHELGHNLSLEHGGRDEVNYKPNYLSVMNYNQQTTGLIANGQSGYLDYSRWTLPSLNEFKLNEKTGLGADPATFVAGAHNPGINQYGVYYFCQGDDPKSVGPQKSYTANGPANWDCDKQGVSSPQVASDITADGVDNILPGNDDWSKLVFSGGAVGGNGIGITPLSVTPAAEITQEQNSLIVPPYAVAISGMNALRTAPGSQPTLRFVVANRGANADTYTLSANTRAGWSIAPSSPATLALAAGAQGEIALTYTVPAGANSGDSDVLNFNATSQNAPLVTDSVEVGVYAEANPAPLAVSAASLVFGTQTVGTASTAVATVLVNTGTAPISFPATTVTGEFSQANTCPALLAVGASCVVNVTFAPTVSGVRTGTLSIVSSASGTPLVITLRGSGVSAPLQRPIVALEVVTANGFAGQAVTLKATIAGSTGSSVPTGNIVFYNSLNVLATVALNRTGIAIYATSSLGAGTYAIYASYAGDAGFASTNTPYAALTLVDALQTSTALKSSANPNTLGTPVTFTATVTSSSSTVTPVGTVTFYDGATSLGTATLNSGVAVYTTSSLALGSHPITASYAGDTVNLPSTSTALTQTTTAATITLSASQSNLTVARGSNGTLTITATPTGPFTGTVTFSCGSLPTHASCVFAPSTLSFTSATAAQTVSLTFATKDATVALHSLMRSNGSGIVAALFLPIGLLGLSLRKRGGLLSRLGLLTLGLAFLAIPFGLTGCGNNNSNTTAAGAYAVSVSAAANGATSQITLNVSVQ